MEQTHGGSAAHHIPCSRSHASVCNLLRRCCTVRAPRWITQRRQTKCLQPERLTSTSTPAHLTCDLHQHAEAITERGKTNTHSQYEFPRGPECDRQLSQSHADADGMFHTLTLHYTQAQCQLSSLHLTPWFQVLSLNSFPSDEEAVLRGRGFYL